MAGELLIAEAAELLAPKLATDSAAAALRLSEAAFPQMTKALGKLAGQAGWHSVTQALPAPASEASYLVTSLSAERIAVAPAVIRKLASPPTDESLFANPILLWNRKNVVPQLLSNFSQRPSADLAAQTATFEHGANDVLTSNHLPAVQIRPFTQSDMPHDLLYGNGNFWFTKEFPLADLESKVRAIVHEGTHHEQLHLMIVNLADKLGISGRPTFREADLIREALANRLGNPDPEYPLSDRTAIASLQARPARLLTKLENDRAERMLDSWRDLTREHRSWEAAFAANCKQLKQLEADYNTFQWIQRTSVSAALKQRSGNASLDRLADLLPKNRRGLTNWRNLDDHTVAHTIWKKLYAQHAELRRTEAELLRQNRQRPHEVEAYATEEGVAQLLNRI